MEREYSFWTSTISGSTDISLRWVTTEKIYNGKQVVEAWLVARGSEKDSSNTLKDSPTYTNKSMELILALLSSEQMAL